MLFAAMISLPVGKYEGNVADRVCLHQFGEFQEAAVFSQFLDIVDI